MPANFEDLVKLMQRLRSPDGCPWDREQTYATLAPMLLEEAYEAFEAVEEARAGRPGELRDELGDLLFQIVFYAQVAEEQGDFSIADVTSAIHAKMVRRHPHVFGEVNAADTATVLRNWETMKQEERRAAGKDEREESLLDGVSSKAPALMEAHQLSSKAARVGFDWEKLEDIFAKLEEEVGELRAAIQTHAASNTDDDHTRVREELGDVLFTVANVARYLRIEPESALKVGNRKFYRRFRQMELYLKDQGREPQTVSASEWESIWLKIKERSLSN